MTALPPAGWYPDPDSGGATWRWWDGVQWAPPAPTYGYGYGPAVAPAFMVEKYREATRKYGNWLRWVMLGSLAAGLGFWIIAALAFRGKGIFDLGPNDAGEPQFSGGFIAVQLLSVPLSALSFAYVGSLIAWIYQAGKFAEARGWPGVRSRTLGAFSVLIPVVSLWWPYESIRDSYPPGSASPLLLKWWVSYLVSPFFAMPVFFVVLFGPPALIAIAIAAGALAIPVWLGRKLIRDVEAMQRANTEAQLPVTNCSSVVLYWVWGQRHTMKKNSSRSCIPRCDGSRAQSGR